MFIQDLQEKTEFISLVYMIAIKWYNVVRLFI